jgi:hypothetical protein
MNTLKYAFVLASLFLIVPGCKSRKAENLMQTRELALNQKEQELLLREKKLELKEAALMEIQNRLDSTMKVDTTKVLYQPLIGLWNAKMICTETTCAGSAVGDNKAEQWDFSYQSNTIIAKAMVNKNISRVYTGTYTGNSFELTENRTDTTVAPDTRMFVRINIIDSTHMAGQRQIIREGDCRIVYDLKLEKS